MAARELLAHFGPNGETSGELIAATGYRSVTWAVNVAVGLRDAAGAVGGWMVSLPHRANLLDDWMTEVGLGLSTSGAGRSADSGGPAVRIRGGWSGRGQTVFVGLVDPGPVVERTQFDGVLCAHWDHLHQRS